MEITGRVNEPLVLVWLHAAELEIKQAAAMGAAGSVPLVPVKRAAEELLGLQAMAPLLPGTYSFVIEYEATIRRDHDPASNDTGDAFGVFERVVSGQSFLFTQSQPTFARRLFPCIDEPDRKVPWELTVETRQADVVASNAPVLSEEALGRGRKRVAFARTKPLPSYLVAFAAGPFTVIQGETRNGGVPVRLLTAGDPHASSWVLQLAADAIDQLARWTDVAYPYEKLDIVSVPRIAWAGMENAGLITLRDELVAGQVNPTLLLHEVAHHWFGNLVTLSWWDEIWLNESLATWLATRIADPSYPLTAAGRQRAISALSVPGHVRHPVNEARDLRLDAFIPAGSIARGVALLDLVEYSLGAETFRSGIRRYVRAHAHRNATSADLLNAFQQAAGSPATPSFHDAVTRLFGAPVVTLQARPVCEGGGARFELDASAPLDVCIAYDDNGGRAEACSAINGATSIPLRTAHCPAWVMPNADARGLYRIEWATFADGILSRGWDFLNARERDLLIEEADGVLTRLAFLARHLASGQLPGDPSATPG